MHRVIVAGVGNVLHQDDGFGVAVVQALSRAGDLPACVELLDIGIGGMALIQSLEQPCSLLLIVDAFARGGTPGTLYQLEPQIPDLDALSLHERRDYLADTHYATPMRALAFARSIGRLPATVRILGCEPVEADELGIGLHAPVADAIGPACELIRGLIAEHLAAPPLSPPSRPNP